MRSTTYKQVGVAAGLAVLAAVTITGCSVPDTSTHISSAEATSTYTGVTAAPVTQTYERSSFTAGQNNAIKKARSYLGYTAFSKQGLIEQLEYEGFATADAEFAVENITVDWNEQAVKKARSYLGYTSFSLEGLVEQLEYEKFTPAEAQYGASTAYGS